MAVTPASRAPAGLDPALLRRDFPIFERLIHGHPLAYLDSASTAQKPRAVLDAVQHLYTHSYANVHRGVYTLSVEATEQYEGARDKVAALIGAPSRRECVFVRDTTEGLNLVAYAYGRDRVGPGDVIVATEMEHHSNLVPWQLLASKTGAKLRYLPLTPEGRLDLDALERFATEGPLRIVAAVHQSNSLGTLNPIPELAERAHALGAVLVVDGAQSVPHRAVDVTALGCDFFAFSSHKMCGPTGAGLLWGREELLADMDPFITGGEMIGNVTLERTSWNELPWKFEGGTPSIAECVGFGAAVDYLTAIGFEAIERHEHELTAYAYDRLAALPGLRILGPGPEARGGILSFTFAGIHPHDVAEELDKVGICVRAGHHCTQPAMAAFGVPATTRASFYLYTTRDEIDRLADGLERVRGVFA
jgi:cysteine desulfurase / selenocysteine lyase